jgi:CBS domain containing-hemolysin-like protein
VPVYEETREHVVGLLLVKSLILLDPEDATPIRDVYRSREGSLLSCTMHEPLFELLDKFQTGKSE